MKKTVASLAAAIGARVLSGPTAEIAGVASLGSATPDDLVFVQEEGRLADAMRSAAGAVIAGEFAAQVNCEKPLMVAANPRLAFARAANLLQGEARHVPGVHATAAVHSSAQLGKDVAVEAHAVISEGAIIGDGTHIGAGTSIAGGVRIGRACDLAANVSVYSGTTIGDRVVIHSGAVLGADGFGFVRDPASGAYEKFPQVGRLEIGNDVEIGANTTIDRGALDATVIGSGTKLDDQVHIAHNVIVGRNVVIAAQTGISGSVVIEDNVVIGGQVGIGDHVRICEGVILGSKCGVLTGKTIRGKGVVFWGVPAKPLREYLKELATLARLAKK